MKIVDVEACTAAIPLERPATFATRVVHERHFCLVRVRREDGIGGLGYCYVGSRAGHLATLTVRDLLRDSVIGRDSEHTEQIWDSMYREALLQGRGGLVFRAMSAIDNALWDANSKAAGLPLYRYLGASREDTVPAYASGGYYAQSATPPDLAREVESYVEMGFKAVKVKVGRLSPREDAARLAAARNAMGPDVELFLNANNAWSDAPTAISAIRTFEPSSPGWIEEPVMPDEVDMMAAIARAVETPVATGEIDYGRWAFKRLLDAGAASVLQPDLGVCGGVTEWRRIAALAAAHGVPVAPHSRQESHVHLVASTPNATWLEYFPDDSITNISRVFTTALEIVDGEAAVPDRPGFGTELDEEALATYWVDGWG